VVVVFGVVTSTLLTLMVLPVLYLQFADAGGRRGSEGPGEKG
jgi:Cu/Ag efflux pump CusA